MLNVDHRTICKFPDACFPGYLQVLDYLDDIRKRLLAGTPSQHNQQDEGIHDEGPLENVLPDGNKKAGLYGGRGVGGSATSNTPGLTVELRVVPLPGETSMSHRRPTYVACFLWEETASEGMRLVVIASGEARLVAVCVWDSNV